MSKRTQRRARQRACNTQKGEQPFWDNNDFAFTVNIEKWADNEIRKIEAEYQASTTEVQS